MNKPLALAPGAIAFVIDTSTLIEFKKLVRIEEQWNLLTDMTAFVAKGVVAFPKQVAKELAYGQHPDAPGAWISSAKAEMCHAEPDDESVAAVLAVGPELVDVEATADREVADPYVAAMACEIRDDNPMCRVVVVTKDVVDRLPAKLSLKTACDRLDVEVWLPADFVAWLKTGIAPGPAAD